MVFKTWNYDEPIDKHRISANVETLLEVLYLESSDRSFLSESVLKAWHVKVYSGCSVPDQSYVGRFRGDVESINLQRYRVLVGPKEGVWPSQVAEAMSGFIHSANSALKYLDNLIVGEVKRSDDVAEVVRLAALAHGEFVRIHPFANGNGRIARLLTNFVALRYGLPAFVAVKPRPANVAYVAAAERSMGVPPDFTGDHAATTAVFYHMLAASLQNPEAEIE